MTEKRGGGGSERGWRNNVGRREREKSKKKSSWKSKKKADTGMHFKKNKLKSGEIRHVSVSVYHGGIDEYNKTL